MPGEQSLVVARISQTKRGPLFAEEVATIDLFQRHDRRIEAAPAVAPVTAA